MIGVHVDLQTKNVVKIELFDHESSPYIVSVILYALKGRRDASYASSV